MSEHSFAESMYQLGASDAEKKFLLSIRKMPTAVGMHYKTAENNYNEIIKDLHYSDPKIFTSLRGYRIDSQKIEEGSKALFLFIDGLADYLQLPKIGDKVGDRYSVLNDFPYLDDFFLHTFLELCPAAQITNQSDPALKNVMLGTLKLDLFTCRNCVFNLGYAISIISEDFDGYENIEKQIDEQPETITEARRSIFSWLTRFI